MGGVLTALLLCIGIGGLLMFGSGFIELVELDAAHPDMAFRQCKTCVAGMAIGLVAFITCAVFISPNQASFAQQFIGIAGGGYLGLRWVLFRIAMTSRK